jgi:hypothetical protein
VTGPAVSPRSHLTIPVIGTAGFQSLERRPARLLPRLLGNRKTGPVFLTNRRARVEDMMVDPFMLGVLRAVAGAPLRLSDAGAVANGGG